MCQTSTRKYIICFRVHGIGLLKELFIKGQYSVENFCNWLPITWKEKNHDGEIFPSIAEIIGPAKI